MEDGPSAMIPKKDDNLRTVTSFQRLQRIVTVKHQIWIVIKLLKFRFQSNSYVHNILTLIFAEIQFATNMFLMSMINAGILFVLN